MQSPRAQPTMPKRRAGNSEDMTVLKSSSSNSSEAPSRVEVSFKIISQCLLPDTRWIPKEICIAVDPLVSSEELAVFHSDYGCEDQFRAKVFTETVKPNLEKLVGGWEVLRP